MIYLDFICKSIYLLFLKLPKILSLDYLLQMNQLHFSPQKFSKPNQL